MKGNREMKIVGTRKDIKRKGFSEDLNKFMELCVKLRSDNCRGIPRGVYKFKTFEEENEWTIRMLAGRKSQADPQP
jgi:hypothetical protein